MNRHTQRNQHFLKHMRLWTISMILSACLITPTFADQADPLSPEDSLARIHVPEGVIVELVAAEPEIFDPVAMCFDAHGNLYVVEDRGYPSGDPSGPVGSVALLQDRDGDGRYEHRTTFAEGFEFPNGIMPWKDGVLVTAAPNVYYLKDTDGDLKADVREVFQAPKVGAVAGCYMTDGYVLRASHVRVLRESVLVYDGVLASLRRFKDDVNEVRRGTECGIGVKDYNDVKAGDQIEVYDIKHIARELD
ncbi:MAG: hypothetical protein JKY69_03850 [Flavobacteriaceae bacterium]|nr:hypothetical protein [Flavobacteriaceae bacterium]